jgi:hypothetical protein
MLCFLTKIDRSSWESVKCVDLARLGAFEQVFHALTTCCCGIKELFKLKSFGYGRLRTLKQKLVAISSYELPGIISGTASHRYPACKDHVLGYSVLFSSMHSYILSTCGNKEKKHAHTAPEVFLAFLLGFSHGPSAGCQFFENMKTKKFLLAGARTVVFCLQE